MTDGTEAITTVHFALMALLAVLVLIGIVAGMRRKRRRVEAAKQVEAHAAEAGVEPEPPAEDEAAAGEHVASPAPVAPAPPPMADQPVAGTPPVSDETAPARPTADEPIAAAIAPDGTTATIVADADAPATATPGDEPLTVLKGLGPKVAQRLGELGIDRVGQLAALDDAGAAALDAQLGAFAGRMARDRWIEQARLLTAGDRAGFEQAFGRL